LSEGTQPGPAIADYSQWQAQDYFKTYYSEVVLPDEQVVLAYQVETLKRIEHKFGRGLEYGCGPTLHRAIAAARYAFRIDMADWLPDNLTEVQAWVNSTSANDDWNRFTHYILGCEGETPDARRIARREEQTHSQRPCQRFALAPPVRSGSPGFLRSTGIGILPGCGLERQTGLASLHVQRTVNIA
jgi:hypothetical protein